MSAWVASNHGHTLTRDRITITDKSRTPLSGALLSRVAGLVWDLYVTYPPTRRRGPLGITIVPADDPRLDDDPSDPESWTGAMTDMETGEMLINERSFHDRGTLGNFMPIAGSVPNWVYTITHEWGHETTPSLHVAHNVKSLELDYWLYQDDLSRYGESDPAEAYAEVFAEYVLSHGQTSNPAAREYATEYGFRTVDPS